jgi:predicted HD superfamily hydrolase involved in NAD metabolism
MKMGFTGEGFEEAALVAARHGLGGLWAALPEWLGEDRARHVGGVVVAAERLAKLHGADPRKAVEAAIWHDWFRGADDAALARLAGERAVEAGGANLAHGRAAAEYMRRERGVADEDLLNAVRFHTTGRPGMSTLEKVVFIADKTEPHRDYPGVEALRGLAAEDLDAACLSALRASILHVKAKGEALDSGSAEAALWLESARPL